MFIYQADVYCDACGQAIRAELAQAAIDNDIQGMPTPSTPEVEYDSDQYPKLADDNQESDTPQHCANGDKCRRAEVLPSGRKIGKLIGNNLTLEGARYVSEVISEGGEVAEFWAERFAGSLS